MGELTKDFWEFLRDLPLEAKLLACFSLITFVFIPGVLDKIPDSNNRTLVLFVLIGLIFIASIFLWVLSVDRRRKLNKYKRKMKEKNELILKNEKTQKYLESLIIKHQQNRAKIRSTIDEIKIAIKNIDVNESADVIQHQKTIIENSLNGLLETLPILGEALPTDEDIEAATDRIIEIIQSDKEQIAMGNPQVGDNTLI